MNYLQDIGKNNPVKIKEKMEVETKMKQKITKKGYKKQNRGITLVALVVTIVVLLILSGITITALFGENGIISQAQKAKDATENDEKNTQQEFANLADRIDKLTGNYDQETGWNLDKVTKVVVDGRNIPVPKGYSLSQATGENSVNTGLVLYQDIEGKEGSEENIVNDSNVETARKTRNQFVWVPVPDVVYDGETTIASGTYTPMAKLQEGSSENYMGMLYTFNNDATATYQSDYKPGSTNNREPDVITKLYDLAGNCKDDYDSKSTNLEQAGLPANSTANDFIKQLQNEFNIMVESIKLYKGFYIGRYETSGFSDTDTKVKPIVQKGKTAGTFVNWYKMYNESKNVKANDNVTTSMIWGCQWDTTLRWFQTSTVDKVKNFPTNSASYGNYEDNTINYVNDDGDTVPTTEGTGTVIPTGSSEATKINNIYDMAGNVLDWTIEAKNDFVRVVRRGLLRLFWFGLSSF